MKRQITLNFIGIVLLVLTFGAAVVFSQTTEFSYQGFLSDNSASANGNFDFEFRLFDAATGGTFLGSRAQPNVRVTNGVFSVVLDFGEFASANRFLEIALRPPGGGTITTLAPRSKLLSTPYSTNAINATNSQNAANSINATNAVNSQNAQNSSQLGGVPANQYVLTNDVRLSDARNPLPNSANYIQNRTTVQSGTNFNIIGDGTVNGTLTGTTVSATTQFNLGSNRVLAKVGANNLFLGALAGRDNGGIQNTMIGDSAGKINTGNENVMFGFVAGQDSTTGSFNTFVGSRAGLANLTGGNNTFLGYKADAGSNNLTNATAIGANALVGQSNALILGSISGVNGATVNTDVGIGTTTPARKLDVNGNIRIGTGTTGCVEDRDGTAIAGNCSSDLRFKKNITSFDSILNNFSKLRPVNYFWRTDEFADRHFGTKQSYGLVAQEVETLFPELVSTDEKGFKAVNYSKLPLLTIQAVKELKAENDALKQQLQSQQQQIDRLKKAFGLVQSESADSRKKVNRSRF